MKRLCRRMNIPLWQAIGILESIWQLTARQAPRGDIGHISDEDIALAIDYRGDETELIESLVFSGWLERDSVDRLIVHDWHEHADDAVQMRLARARLFFVHGVPPKLRRLGKHEKELADEFYNSVRTNIEIVRTNIETVRTPCAPPEPEPRQSPATNTEASSVIQESSALTRVSECAQRMYKAHPKKRDPQLVLGALRMALNGKDNRNERLLEIETCHGAWVKTENWRKESGRFAPPLAKWISDEGFTQWPNGAKPAVVDPTKVLPYDPFQFEKKVK